MFLHDFAYVDAPADLVCARILGNHGAWLSHLATEAVGEGEALRVRIGPAEPVPVPSVAAEVELGEPRRRAGNDLVLPLTWRASSAAVGFPEVTGDLEIAALGATRTQLSFMGRYDPPLGGAGGRLDQIAFHRIAEASVRAFLSRLAGVLAQPEGDALICEARS